MKLKNIFQKCNPLTFTDDPKDFKLRIVPSWFSEDYVSFEYTANGGKTWKTIKCADSPFLNSLEYDWKWKTLSYRLTYNADFSHEKEKFSSYQKIKDFEAAQKKIYEEGVINVEKERKEVEERRKAKYKSLNNEK
ncbi:MAG: hypothetical protein WC554_14565 [Clostridia bacterium]